MEIPTELNTSLNTLLNYACGDVFFFYKKKVGALVNFLYQREREVILGRLAQEGRGTCLIIWIKNGIPSF